MNKNQSITLIIGFILIILTWIYGVSQFQTYEDIGGFGQIYRGRRAKIGQRIKNEVLIPTVFLEIIGAASLIYLFKDTNKQTLIKEVKMSNINNQDKPKENNLNKIIKSILIFFLWWIGISIILGIILFLFRVGQGIAGPIGFIFGIYKAYQYYISVRKKIY